MSVPHVNQLIKKININEIIPNENNPRFIKDNEFYKLVKSIKEFPEMLYIRPIVVNSKMIVLGGNMRLKACLEAGLKEVPIIMATNLTEEQEREFIIKDNISGGQWDWDILANEWDVELLEDWGLENIDIKNKNDFNEIDLSNEITTSFRIEVTLTNEKEQELLYNNLIEKGYECRILTL